MFNSNQDVINYLNKNYNKSSTHYLSWLVWGKQDGKYEIKLTMYLEVDSLEIKVSRCIHHSALTVPMNEIIKGKINLIEEVIRIVKKRLNEYIEEKESNENM